MKLRHVAATCGNNGRSILAANIFWNKYGIQWIQSQTNLNVYQVTVKDILSAWSWFSSMLVNKSIAWFHLEAFSQAVIVALYGMTSNWKAGNFGFLQQSQCLVPLDAVRACADGRCVSNLVRWVVKLQHLIEDLQCRLPWTKTQIASTWKPWWSSFLVSTSSPKCNMRNECCEHVEITRKHMWSRCMSLSCSCCRGSNVIGHSTLPYPQSSWSKHVNQLSTMKFISKQLSFPQLLCQFHHVAIPRPLHTSWCLSCSWSDRPETLNSGTVEGGPEINRTGTEFQHCPFGMEDTGVFQKSEEWLIGFSISFFVHRIS